MPIYEYVCSTCRTHFEQVRLMKEMDDPAPCPRCSTPALRQVSRFAFKRATAANNAVTSQPVHMSGCACCSPGRWDV